MKVLMKVLMGLCFSSGMLAIALLIAVYLGDKRKREDAERAARQEEFRRRQDLQARAMERQLERDKMFEQAQFYEVWVNA